MPQYCFENPVTKEIKEVFIPISAAERTYSEDGVIWNRIWTVPQASFDTNWDERSSKDFVTKSSTKRGGTIGDLWNKSAELSAKREQKGGRDLVKDKHFSDYSKKTGGRIHPEIVQQNKNKTAIIDFAKKGVTFE